MEYGKFCSKNAEHIKNIEQMGEANDMELVD